jgi:hypothetical protein
VNFGDWYSRVLKLLGKSDGYKQYGAKTLFELRMTPEEAAAEVDWEASRHRAPQDRDLLPSKPVTTPASLGTMVERAEHPAFVAIFKLLAVLVVGFFRAIRLGDADKIAG